jgi:hypothetical protein
MLNTSMTVAATSPVDSVWTRKTTRLCHLPLCRPGVVLSCKLVVASPLVILSLRRPLVVLMRQLVVASPLAVLSLRCPLIILLRQLVVALPLAVLSLCQPLVNSSSAYCRMASPRPLIVPHTALSSFRRAGWLLHRLLMCHPFIVLSSCRAASRCLVAPAGCRAIISCRPLVALPSLILSSSWLVVALPVLALTSRPLVVVHR